MRVIEQANTITVGATSKSDVENTRLVQFKKNKAGKGKEWVAGQREGNI